MKTDFKVLLIFVLLFLSCVPSRKVRGVPFKKYLNRYPVAFYLRGIGEGSTLQEAKDNARIELAKKIKVRIKARITDILKEESRHTQKLKEEFIKISSAEVDEVLSGVEIPHVEKTETGYRALAVLSREKAASRINKKMKNLESEISSIFRNAQTLSFKKDFLNSLKEFIKAYALLSRYYLLKEEKDIIISGTLEAELSKEEKEVLKFSDIEREILKIMKPFEISLVKKPEKIQKGITGNYPVILKTSFAGKEQNGVPLKMSLTSGKCSFDERGVTDAHGRAIFNIYYVDPSSSDPLKIKVSVDETKIIPEGIDLFFKDWISSILELKSLYIDIFLEGEGYDEIYHAINALIAGLKMKKIKGYTIFVEDFIEKGKGSGGEIGRILQEKLKEILAGKGYRVSERYEKSSGVLKGEYSIYGDNVNVSAKIVDRDGVVLGGSSVIINFSVFSGYFNVGGSVDPDIYSDFSYGELEIKIWVDRGENGIYREGEEAVIYVKANKSCFIKIYDFSSNGKITQLFPNEYSPSGWIEGGRVYKIPGDFGGFALKAVPPYGTEVIKVFASTKEFETPEEVKSANRFVENVRALAVVEKVEYAEASTTISIIPK